MGKRRWYVGREYIAIDEADVKYHRDSRDHIQEEKERKEIAINDKAADHYFDDEYPHNGQSDNIEVDISLSLEDCSAKIIEKERIQGEDRDDYLVLETI